MNNGPFKAIILSLLIVLPLALYFFAKGCTTQVFKPVHKAFILDAAGDTTYLQSPSNFTLYDAKGGQITADSLKGKLFLMIFFPPKADSATMSMSQVAFGNLKQDIYEIARDVPGFRIIAVATSSTDTSLLASYQKKWDVPIEKWAFTTASKADVIKLGQTAFQLPEFVGQDTASFGFPCQNMVFVDKKGFVRGYYDKYTQTYKNYYQATQLGVNGTRTLTEDFRALLMQEYSNMKLKVKN